MGAATHVNRCDKKKNSLDFIQKKLENQIEKHVWVHTLINYLVGSIHYRIMCYKLYQQL